VSPLTACKDTKTLQENEHLKAHEGELQKENGQLGNDLETMTAPRDALTKENEKLKAEIRERKTKGSGKLRVGSVVGAKGHGNFKGPRVVWSARTGFRFIVRKREVRSMKTFEVQFRYRNRNEETVESTIKVEASSLPGAVGKAAREFVKGLDRKQRFDMNKNGLDITAKSVGTTTEAQAETSAETAAS